MMQNLAKFVKMIAALVLSFNQINISFGKTWDTLHMTWAPPPNPQQVNPLAFSNLPVTAKEAEENGYVSIGESRLFKGKRYIRDNDVSNILLFSTDHRKRLIGIQSQFPESKIVKKTKWVDWFKKSSFFIVEDKGDGDTYYTLTAYTVNPYLFRAESILCLDKVGCGLWIQQRKNGSNDEYLSMPLIAPIERPGSWTKEKCVDGMGVHYQWNITEDMDCMDLLPFFLLFKDGNLIAFGWQIASKFDYSKRLELQPKTAFPLFFYNVPKCLDPLWDETEGVMTVHFYFNDDPQNLQCPKED